MPVRETSPTSWLHSHSPRFSVNGDNIHIIASPQHFYECLLHKVSTADHRITLAALYIGTGQLEQNLINAISKRMCEKPHLRVQILLDRLRGTRGKTNSITYLLPLLIKYPKRIRISLYTTPILTAHRLYIPQRFNETIGVQHIKAYIFDDDVIVSGCNLAHMYFTNRQDRYVLVENSPQLVQYVDEIVSTVSLYSETVTESVVKVSKQNALLSLHLGEAIKKLILKFLKNNPIEPVSDTIIHPTLQLYHHGIHQDQIATQEIFSNPGPNDILYISSGYFNMPELYIDAIISSQARYHILSASQEAHGFFQAQGVSGHVPLMYLHRSNMFLKRITNLNDRIKFYEFQRHNWSFHAKGVWYYRDGSELPVLTLVGSPNYGYRSIWRDIELQFFIQTRNESLQKQFDTECKHLYNSTTTTEIKPKCIRERYVARYVKLASRILRSFL